MMHPRNRYCHNKPDFGALAEDHPPLKPFLIQKRGRGTHGHTPPGGFAFTIDFSDPAALRELTCALLARDFGLKLEIPLDKLIPTVPLRLNYIHWVEDLLSLGPGEAGSVPRGEAGSIPRGEAGSVPCRKAGSVPRRKAGSVPRREAGSIPRGDTVVGVDIGTGASCIYPLLGARLNGWRFLATETEGDSIKCARENVGRNALEDKISVKQVTESTVLEEALEPSMRYHFCMCNPPFFKDQAERYGNQSRSGHRPVPGTVSTGIATETVTAGGEVEFVRRMIADSLKLKDSVRWYTSMLGKKASLKAVQAELKKHQIPVVTTTEFVQGKTWRWAVAWSFDETLKETVSQPAAKIQHHRPFKLLVSGYQPTAEGFQKVLQWLQGQFSELQIVHEIVNQTSESISINCQALKNTWSHQRKRRRLLKKLQQQQARPGQEEKPEGTLSTSRESVGSESSSGIPQTEAYTNTCTTAAQSSSEDVTKNLHAGSESQTVTQEPPPVAQTSDLITRQDLCSELKDSDQNKHRVILDLEPGLGDSAGSDTGTTVTSPSSITTKQLLEVGSGKTKQKPSVVSASFSETLKDPGPSQESLEELDAMCTPCDMEFRCSVFLGTGDELPGVQAKKRRKRDGSSEAMLTSESGNETSGDKMIMLSFELIRGEDNDSLHQIVQYIKNKLQLLQ